MIIIAIDGPAASGKGLLSRRLAKHYCLAHLDTGLLYRAVGWQAAQKNMVDEKDIVVIAQSLKTQDLENPELRGDEAAQWASKVAVFEGVRQALLNFQRHFAQHPGKDYKGAILDGRDITTVVLPDADVKFYVTADVEVRAQRRYEELKARGVQTTYDAVLDDMEVRDARDRNRENAPLMISYEAYPINATHLTPDEVFDRAVTHIEAKRHL